MSCNTEAIDTINRLRAATEPDRSLDFRIAYLLGWRHNGFEWREQSRDQPWLSDEQFTDLDMMAGSWKKPSRDEWPRPGTTDPEPPAYTSSIDEVRALFKSLPPTVNVHINWTRKRGVVKVSLRDTTTKPMKVTRCVHTSEPIASLVALLSHSLTGIR